MNCNIILSSEIKDDKCMEFSMRECLGYILVYNDRILLYNLHDSCEYDNVNKNNIHICGKLITTIRNYKGYWPYAVYEGSEPILCGENLLIALNYYNYIMITGGYGGPFVCQFKTINIITKSLYTVCSGGDPGIIFALNDTHIYTTSYPENLCIKRDYNFEKKFNMGINTNIQTLLDLYLSYRQTPSRGFGYDIIDTSQLKNKFDIEEIPLEIKEIHDKNINGNDITYNKFPLLKNNQIYLSLFLLSKQILSGKTDYYIPLKHCLENLFNYLKNNTYEFDRFNNISSKVNLYKMFKDIYNKLLSIIYSKYDFSNDCLNCRKHLIEFLKCYDDNLLLNIFY